MKFQELVNDILITQAAVTTSIANRKLADKSLLEALAAAGTPLNVGGQVVIGGILITRPYEHLELKTSDVLCVDGGTNVEAWIQQRRTDGSLGK